MKLSIVLGLVLLVVAAIAVGQISVTQTQTGPIVGLDSILVGARGTRIRAIQYGSSSLDPPSVAATSRNFVDFTVTGADVNDICVLTPPTALHDDLLYVGCKATGVNTIRVFLYNPTAGAIDDVAATWYWVWFDVT